MSLKAKLEAVIYAAEEPVTLPQLAALFANDAYAYKAEQDALRLESAQGAENESDGVHLVTGEDLLPGEFGGLQNMPGAVSAEGLTSEPDAEAAVEAPVTEEAVAEAAAVDPEMEAKRAQRQREREVREILRGVLDELIEDYASDGRGLEIREIAGGFRLGTKPEMHDAVRAFVKSLKPPLKLSLPALETLAVIAYKQPVTAPEVGEIRGVDSAGVLGSLMSRKLIATAGRKQVIGRPMLYKTTKEFLLRFGLKDVQELPSMEEFEKMAAIELSDVEEDEADAGPAESTGDLFAEAPEASEAPEEATQATEAVTPSTAEIAEDAPALVERQNAEEVEVSS